MVLLSSGLLLGGLLPRQLLGLLKISLLQKELLLTLGQLALDVLQFLVGVAKPGLRLSNALLEICFCFVHHGHPGSYLVLAGAVERLELLEVSTHGLKEPLFLGAAATSARLVNMKVRYID